MTDRELTIIAADLRKRLIDMHFKAKSNHLGASLSELDALAFLFNEWLRPDDSFILSKGHGASGLYATLHRAARLSDAQIETYYNSNGTHLPAHPAPGVSPWIPAATGSLGHGLSIAAGLALGAHMKGEGKRVVCLMSDGEWDEGSNWEAALFASHRKLANLTAIVDWNGIQGFGRVEDVMALEPFAEKFAAFGWSAQVIDGHSFAELRAAFERAPAGKPRAILARTIKGKGVSFAENTVDWHYLNLDEKLRDRALADVESGLDAKLAELGASR